MSRSLGPQLPEPVVRALSAARGDRADRAILIATADAAGRPHPALLTYGEVLAEGPATLRLTAYANSATAENLRARGAVTLCLVEPGSAHYVKARARELASPLPGRAFFEATVEDVRRDEVDPMREDAAEIVTGITYRAQNPSRRAQDDAAIRNALRAAGR